MKICFLAEITSVHTVRWVNAMAARGHQVNLMTMHPDDLNKIDERVIVHTLRFPPPSGYYLNITQAKKRLREMKPDLLHVHYASGYGTLGRHIGYEPTLLSVWGSDVYLFPYQNKRNEKILRKNLAHAKQLTATGHALKNQTALFTDQSKPIDIVAFGIDTDLFSSLEKTTSEEVICIGTVKRLKEIYGIDILLKAVSGLIDLLRENHEMHTADKIKLLIVGSGPERDNLEHLASSLGIRDRTEFVKEVANDQVPSYLNQLDIYCALSRSESFGVAVLEASSCEIPVVVSDVGGLPEVVRDGQTGYITSITDISLISRKLYELVSDAEVRKTMGKNGRKFVNDHYDWQKNVTEMEDVYRKLIASLINDI